MAAAMTLSMVEAMTILSMQVEVMMLSMVEAMTILSMQVEVMMLSMAETLRQKEMMAVKILLFSQALQTNIEFLLQQTLTLDMSITFKIQEMILLMA